MPLPLRSLPYPLGHRSLQANSLLRPHPTGTLISMTTWEHSLGEVGDTRSQPHQSLPGSPPQATVLWEPHLHKCYFQLIA